MSSKQSPEQSSESQKRLQEKLIGSIWLQNNKYPYSFEPDGSCQILNHNRSGHYTISPDGNSVFLTWTIPPYTEELRVLDDGSFFLGGSVLVSSNKSNPSPFPYYPLPQPDLNSYQFQIDTGKIPNDATITLEGKQVRLLVDTGYSPEDLYEFDSEEEAEEYYHSTIRYYDLDYSPGSINEPIYLEFSDDHSHKFYEITVTRLTVTIRYGRIGTTGQTNSNTYTTPRKAQAAAEKEINEKLKQGYVLLSNKSALLDNKINDPSEIRETVVLVNISEPGKTINDSSNSNLDINQFIRPAWKPIVTEGDQDLLASKFCGRPWLAQNEAWPACPHCNEPMQLFLQLNLGQLPEPVREEFGTGLLQMFHCMSNKCEPMGEYGTFYYGRVPYLIKNVIIRLIQPVGIASTPPLPQIDGEEYGAYLPPKTITDWQEIEDYPHPDELVPLVYGWDKIWQKGVYEDDVPQLNFDFLVNDYEDEYPTDEGDKLGGYPRWVQDLECPGCPVCNTPMRQVFQLASCENLNYMFGDLGIAHIMQCKTHKDQFAFV